MGLSSPGTTPSLPLRQLVSTLEEAGLHRFKASSYAPKPSFVLLAPPLSMLHHRCIAYFRAGEEDGTDATLGYRLDDPARCLWFARYRPDDQECSRKHYRVSFFSCSAQDRQDREHRSCLLISTAAAYHDVVAMHHDVVIDDPS